MPITPTGTVTFLFTDVEGSTRRWEEHPDAMKDALARHDTIVRSAIETRNGVVFTTAGDEFCAAFSSPGSALEAALDIQRRLDAEQWGDVAPFRVRMALHTGNADERDGDYFGPPLNRCARLLSIGHGGQVLVSSVTAQLLAGDLPVDATLVDLGAHSLKDLDRFEQVFQVAHPDLTSGFPPLRSSIPIQNAADLLAEGRQAHAAQRWEDAFVAFTAAGEMSDLESDDLRRFGETAYWTGRTNAALTIKEGAYGKLLRDGKIQAAARTALDLAFLYHYRLATALSKAWLARADDLVGDAEGTEAFGYLMRWRSIEAFEDDGDPERAIELADLVIACGTTLDNRSLRALGLMDKGRFLVSMGQVDEGMVLVDESMVAAVSGEIDPDATGRNFCNMLSVCDTVADYQRAAEWSDAAEAWCNQHSDSAYPGICRIFRAELKWLQGDWGAATQDLHEAIDELTGYTPIIGAAFYQMGQVELRSGELERAADRFRSAHEHGFTPLPGLAALRLAEGNANGAEELLLNAIVDNPQPLDRAKYLPVLIDTELELGHVNEARTFLTELEETAELCHSTAMRAEAADRRAAIAMLDGRVSDAFPDLRTAISSWNGLRMPYEAAQTRLRLADAYRSSGNMASATLEFDTATATLERLGALS